MRVKLREKFLHQWLSQVEALESLLALQELVELVVAELALVLRGIVKAFLC